MTRRETTDAERIAGLREAITAAQGDWHEATNLWSIRADLNWLLERSEVRHPEAGEAPDLRAAVTVPHYGEVDLRAPETPDRDAEVATRTLDVLEAMWEAFTDAGRAGIPDLSADMEEGIRRFEAEAAVSRTWRVQRVPIEGSRHPEAGETE